MADLSTCVGWALGELLKEADARVNWNYARPEEEDQSEDAYTILPGVYAWTSTNTNSFTGSEDNDDAKTLHEDAENICITMHGDNTFEYIWKLQRRGERPTEMTVEMTGDWTKPTMNRSSTGDQDSRVFLTVEKLRFTRYASYDHDLKEYKFCLKTLTRNGSDWAFVGTNEKQLPRIRMIFVCQNGLLQSTGNVCPEDILSTSPASRALVGLTKKLAAKLGSPIDVMSNKWLPQSDQVYCQVQEHDKTVKSFNSLQKLAELLKLASKTRQEGGNLELPKEIELMTTITD